VRGKGRGKMALNWCLRKGKGRDAYGTAVSKKEKKQETTPRKKKKKKHLALAPGRDVRERRDEENSSRAN